MILADAKSSHTIKWANSLTDNGVDVFILSFRKANIKLYNNNIKHLSLKTEGNKISYLKLLPLVKNEISVFKPDILHSFYATSYGLIGALSKFKPFVISVWGSDVFEFPRKSFLHRAILKFNLKKANFIQSTSKAMALEAKNYTYKEIKVIPFGIDTELFKPKQKKDDTIVIGTIKWLEEIYGIKYLIEAFNIIVKKHSDKKLKLLIVGSGSKEEEYKQMVEDYHIEHLVEFTGAVSSVETVKYHQQISIFVALSLQESFGVAILEAAACGVPAVVSNVGGLPEVVDNGKTGFVVKSKNSKQAAGAISKLIMSPELYSEFSNNAREFVVKSYNWNNNIKQQIELYNIYLNKKH
jgi:glycosyltransferase involved in cell wall biosynthesis